MSAQIIQLAGYRARAAAQPAPAKAVSLRTSAENAAAALATMTAACRAWAENLRQIGVGARQIAARSDRMQDDIQALKADARSVNEACVGLSTFSVSTALVAG